MVTPSVALRFRDTTPGVDTINQHRSIIEERGSVWWGWWKKDFEEDPFNSGSLDSDEIDLFIVDRSTARMFVAHARERRIKTDSPPELALIPSYYHHSTKEVHGWFLLTSIEPVPYRDDVASRFGDNTAVVLPDNLHVSRPESKITVSPQQRSSILVLSDLHFGSDYDYLKQGSSPSIGSPKSTLTHCIVEDLKRIGLADDVGAVMITGDFTSNGEWTDQNIDEICCELKALSIALKVDIGSFLALPGNHDVARYPKDWDGDVSKLVVDNQVSFKHEWNFRFFLNALQDRDIKKPLDFVERVQLRDADVLIGVLNSCRIVATSWTEYGYVGPSGIEVISKLGSEPVVRPTFKVVGVHHHLLPVNLVEAPQKNGVTLSLDASKILESAQASGVHIAVHGHQHMPHLSRYQSLSLDGNQQSGGLTVVSNGSAGVSSARRPGQERNTYCIFTFSSGGVRLQMRELRSDAKAGSHLFNGQLDATPVFPK